MPALHYLTQPYGKLKTSHAATMRALRRLGASVERIPGQRLWLASFSPQDCAFIRESRAELARR